MRKWTITVEMKTGEERTFVCQGDTSTSAKERLRRRVSIQYVKNSRPYAEGDGKHEKIGFPPIS